MNEASGKSLAAYAERGWAIEKNPVLDVWTGTKRTGTEVRVLVAFSGPELLGKLQAAEEAP